MRAFLGALLVVAACGKAPSTLGPDSSGSGSGSGTDAAMGSDGSNAGWTALITRTWQLDPGVQTYKCRRIMVPTDMWVSGFRALSPVGTHHEVLTISSTSSPLGDYDCSAGSLDNQMLYAAGVNTDDLVFPPGMAVHLTAGTYINLNLHLFNTTDAPINEESGVLVETIPQAQVTHEIDMMFSGTFNISIPSDGQPHTAAGGCSAPNDTHLFALWPHMHQIATHQKFTVTHSGVTTALVDSDYMFTEQRNYPISETIVYAGDTVLTTCTYVNTTGATVTFGDSSTAEMCFTGMYKYPAGGNLFACVH